MFISQIHRSNYVITHPQPLDRHYITCDQRVLLQPSGITSVRKWIMDRKVLPPQPQPLVTPALAQPLIAHALAHPLIPPAPAHPLIPPALAHPLIFLTQPRGLVFLAAFRGGDAKPGFVQTLGE